MTTRRTAAAGHADRLLPGYELRVDGGRCDGHGICALRFSQWVTLDEWGYASVSAEPVVDRADLARARRAVAACPEGALALLPCAENGAGLAPRTRTPGMRG